jgi:hypothetical protein
MTRRSLFSQTPPSQTEAGRQIAVVNYLLIRDWQVKVTIGNELTSGWPDLYAAHFTHGPRWIEMKRPGERLRESQLTFITDFELVGVGVWVLVSATPEEYRKLFHPPNWREFA